MRRKIACWLISISGFEACVCVRLYVQVLIVTEYVNAGTLRMLWERRKKQGRPALRWDTLSMLLRDAARGLDHLHKSDLLHRDVKTDNFLVHVGPGPGEIRCVLCDFGFSRKTNVPSGGGDGGDGGIARAMTICGTETFMAPEVCRRQLWLKFRRFVSVIVVTVVIVISFICRIVKYRYR